MATHDPTPIKVSPEAPAHQPLLRAAEAAKLLSISERKLWSLTASGEIPAVRIGAAVRYCHEAVADYVAANTKGGQR